jgi:hypothetical protein
VLVLIGVVGLLLGVGGFLGLSSSVAHMQRMSLLTGGSVTIDRPGDYVIYFEPDANLAPGPDGSAPDALAGVRLVGADGSPADTSAPSAQVSYSTGGHSGYAVAALHVAQPSTYRLEIDRVPSVGGQLAVGEGVGGKITGGVVGVAVGSVALFVGFMLLFVGFVLRWFRR